MAFHIDWELYSPHNPKRVYSEVRDIELNGTYSQVSVYRIAVYIHIFVQPFPSFIARNLIKYLAWV